MDPHTSAQDVMRCDLCETAVVQMHCDTCFVNLCKACVGEHFSADFSKPHTIVDFKARKSTLIYPKCRSHDVETCEMYCNQCDIPVCNTCIASDQHLGHNFLKTLEVLSKRREKIMMEHTELNETIYPAYQDIACDVEKSLGLLHKEYEKLSVAITKQEEIWQREIKELVTKLKSKIDEMKNKQLETLQKYFDGIKQKISNIQDEINLIDDALISTNISEIFSILSPVDKYRKFPKKIMFAVPEFSPNKIQEGELYNFKPGILEEHEYKLLTKSESPEAGSSPPVKHLLDEPEAVTTIKIDVDCWFFPQLYNVACLSAEEIWTSGSDKTMKLYSINQGSLLKSITTKSGNRPENIAVTKSGDLVYTDYDGRTVNILKNEQIEEVIRLQNWRPSGVFSNDRGDFLVTMYTDNKQSKVVRYSGSTEKQTIQFDETGKFLFSIGSLDNFISENRNLDICVSDWGARAVMVFNQAGNLRFRYTGHTPAPKNKPFCPRGITTDSQSHILTADIANDCVHIIDQDGEFLRYIDCGLSFPWGLCTDTNDYLYVAQQFKKEVKKIKYQK
ncbi:E3 ubiquitin-protein ligase TRIM71-like [Saccostrea echinata]|uniref:E3 ubiquitin-protein ligase TRIM71-like n=1 Tax=Saccostrea echinata TaxID=191078 RepID=UPI002A7FBE80|nr:E3 ubiquitin-protein ligase TRIM71-like [Saccostrea echinata]